MNLSEIIYPAEYAPDTTMVGYADEAYNRVATYGFRNSEIGEDEEQSSFEAKIAEFRADVREKMQVLHGSATTLEFTTYDQRA